MSKKLFKKEDLPPILEWEDADGGAEFAAKSVSKNLKLGETYFTWNLPLQIHIIYKDGKERKTPCSLKSMIDMDKSWILNYMPRKERTCTLKFSELFIKPPSKQDLDNFTEATAEILNHLGLLMTNVGRRISDDVDYPNCED